MKDSITYHRLCDTPELILSDAQYHGHRMDHHYHLDYHIGLVIEGVQRQHCQGQSVLLGPGRVSVMPPGEVHDGSAYRRDDYRMKTFRLSSTLLAGYFEDIFNTDQIPAFSGAMLEDQALAARLLALHVQLEQSKSLSTLAVEEHWLSLMGALFSDLCPRSPDAVVGGLAPKQWRWVEEYCREHLDSKITLDDLAMLCGLSRFQFLRRFEKTTGLTPKAWLIRLRLENACVLLRRTEQTIADIAAGVGFYDQSHFNRAFRHAYGVAPSQY